MVQRELGAGAALLGAALAVVHLSPGYVTGQLLEGNWGWFPRLDTMGETLVLYHHATDAVAFGIGVGAVFALGYAAGTRLELRNHYRQIALSIGIGGVMGYLATILVVVLYVLFTTGRLVVVELTVLEFSLFVGRILAVPIQFAVVGFAGAALAHVTTDDETSDRPVRTDERTDTSPHSSGD